MTLTEAKASSSTEKTTSAGTQVPSGEENDPLAIANKIAMVEASPPEVLALKPNKAEDATSGSDAVEAEKAKKG
jgi:hypothetical protein